jgi:hypothetical protein
MDHFDVSPILKKSCWIRVQIKFLITKNYDIILLVVLMVKWLRRPNGTQETKQSSTPYSLAPPMVTRTFEDVLNKIASIN